MIRGSPRGYATSADAGIFCCVLDHQPGYLATAAIEDDGCPANSLVTNPSCRFSWVDGTPEAVAEFVPLFCDDGDPMVWVPSVIGWNPYCLGSVYRELLSNLQPGAPPPSRLPQTQARILIQAGILVSHGQVPRWSRNVASKFAQSGRIFRKNRYISIAGLVHPFQMDALRKYYRRLVRRGGMYMGDGQTLSRYVAHNEPVSRFFQHQLTPAISELAGEPLKPSYTYVVSYQGGSALEKHVDREQCEYTISLLVDYPPESKHDSCWPLCIETPAGVVTVTQTIGDALLFRGRELPHFRPKLHDGYTSTSMLLHYVTQDFVGTLD